MGWARGARGGTPARHIGKRDGWVRKMRGSGCQRGRWSGGQLAPVELLSFGFGAARAHGNVRFGNDAYAPGRCASLRPRGTQLRSHGASRRSGRHLSSGRLCGRGGGGCRRRSSVRVGDGWVGRERDGSM